ncbi:MAG: sigma 54-interacting transcriptional regulator, partial [Longimicrobiales bacterium]
ELPQPLQVKLLRVLQEGEFRRVGDTATRTTDVRIIAATNKDLAKAVAEGEFREDLYYRLAVVPIHLPPLRDRAEEIPELVHHLVERHSRRLGVEVEKIEPDAMEILLEYPWPGNVRELENVLERAMVLTEDGTIRIEDLPENVRDPEVEIPDEDLEGGDLSVKRRSAELERTLIQKALERTGGNRTKAAELLDLSPRALRYKIKDYDLED